METMNVHMELNINSKQHEVNSSSSATENEPSSPPQGSEVSDQQHNNHSRASQKPMSSRNTQRSQSAAAQNAGSGQRNTHVLETYVVEQYPSLKEEREKIRRKFRDMEEIRRREAGGNWSPSLVVQHKTNFEKVTKNSTLAIIYKLLSPLIDSVGYLWWDNNGIVGCATCFVFKDSYICTCRHVISDIVGEGIDVSNWPDIISRCAKVTFAYEKAPNNSDRYFSIESWFEISDSTLDYAILKLQRNEQELPPGLYYEIAPAPSSELIYLIGHPDGKPKSIDACEVIHQGQQGERNVEHLQAPAADSFNSHFVHMFTQRSFKGRNGSSTCFFGEASGSPVLDSSGKLVAMHTAGFTYHYGRNSKCVNIEFGSSMKSILNDIKQKHEEWFKRVCGNQ